MRKIKLTLICAGLFYSLSISAAPVAVPPVVIPLVNGGQASVALSNTSPNLFVVPGDRIIAVNSLDGALTTNEPTASGGVVVATLNKKAFTFILETERGQNFSINAVPREGGGRTIELVTDLRGSGEKAGAWESSTPYEAMLVSISQSARGGSLPPGWQRIPVTTESLSVPVGFSAEAKSARVGNHLKIVHYAVTNSTSASLPVSERNFWFPGVRAIMFGQSASQVLPAATLDLWVITDGEAD
ncbi:type-F conjugative transfer system secretin TraK [Pectobacterium aroidearum]|uniref:type-F conjugative transfer system secretin TraK n=1 Tax=Pectobacterium aroidearum TaxID=1201031 RepID=UPI00301A91C1